MPTPTQSVQWVQQDGKVQRTAQSTDRNPQYLGTVGNYLTRRVASPPNVAPVAVYTPSPNFTQGTTTRVTTFSTDQWDYLIVVAEDNGTSDGPIFAITDSQGFTWNKILSPGDDGINTTDNVTVWTTQDVTGTASGTISISVTTTANPWVGVTVLRYANCGGIGATAGAVTAATSTQSITTTRPHSGLVSIISDWNARSGLARVWSGNPTELYYTPAAGFNNYMAVYTDTNTIGSKTVGISGVASMANTMATIEVFAQEAITVIQRVNANSSSGTSSTSATIAAPTAGNLLWFFCASDKDAGTYTGPTGFTAVASNNSSSVSIWVGYKVADGTEGILTISRSLASTAGDWVSVTECASDAGGSWAVDSATHYTDETTVSSWTSGTVASTSAAGAGMAFWAIDSGQSITSGLAANNGFTVTHIPTADGKGGTIVAEHLPIIAKASAVTVTESYSGTADQTSGCVVIFTKTSTSLNAGVTAPITSGAVITAAATTTVGATQAATAVTALTAIATTTVGASQAVTAGATLTGLRTDVAGATAAITAVVSVSASASGGLTADVAASATAGVTVSGSATTTVGTTQTATAGAAVTGKATTTVGATQAVTAGATGTAKATTTVGATQTATAGVTASALGTPAAVITAQAVTGATVAAFATTALASTQTVTAGATGAAQATTTVGATQAVTAGVTVTATAGLIGSVSSAITAGATGTAKATTTVAAQAATTSAVTASALRTDTASVTRPVTALAAITALRTDLAALLPQAIGAAVLATASAVTPLDVALVLTAGVVATASESGGIRPGHCVDVVTAGRTGMGAATAGRTAVAVVDGSAITADVMARRTSADNVRKR